MNDSFKIRITGEIAGEELHPDTLDMTDLIKLMSGLLSVVKTEAVVDYGSQVKKMRLLSLDSIMDECALPAFSAAEVARLAVGRVEAALCFNQMDALQEKAQAKLRSTFGHIFDRGASIQWIGENNSPVYSKQNPLPAPKLVSTFRESSASLLAYVTKIGGDDSPSVTAVFEATGEEITARCNKELCKKMSDDGCLYETVGLIGSANWQTDPWKLLNVHVNDYEKYYQGKASDFIQSLDRGFLNACNTIDINKHMESISGD